MIIFLPIDQSIILNQTSSVLTVSLTTPPPSPPRSLKTVIPSNAFVKNLMVSSYWDWSVTSIVTPCKIAFVSWNSGKVPNAALAMDDVVVDVRRTEGKKIMADVDIITFCKMDRRVEVLLVAVVCFCCWSSWSLSSLLLKAARKTRGERDDNIIIWCCGDESLKAPSPLWWLVVANDDTSCAKNDATRMTTRRRGLERIVTIILLFSFFLPNNKRISRSAISQHQIYWVGTSLLFFTRVILSCRYLSDAAWREFDVRQRENGITLVGGFISISLWHFRHPHPRFHKHASTSAQILWHSSHYLLSFCLSILLCLKRVLGRKGQYKYYHSSRASEFIRST